MNNDLSKLKLYSQDIENLINDIEEVENTTDLVMENFKAMFLELSTNN